MIRPIVSWLAVCDICPETLEYVSCSVDGAIEDVEGDAEWVRLDDGRFVCGASDTAHDTARGGESPAALKPSHDAMTVRYTAPLLSELIAESGNAT